MKIVQTGLKLMPLAFRLKKMFFVLAKNQRTSRNDFFFIKLIKKNSVSRKEESLL